MADPVSLTFRLSNAPPVDQDYANYQERRKQDEWNTALLREQAEAAAQAPTPGAAPAPEKPSAIKTGVEAGAMASADAVRNMVDGLRAVFGMAPSPGVAKALNVPAKEEGEGPPANPIEGAKKIVMNGLLQFGFSPLSGTFAGARQALANAAPDMEQTHIASGFVAAGVRGLLEGKAYASLTPAEQKRYLSPLTVGEVVETIGPMIVPAVAGPAARGAKKVGAAIKEQAPVLMGERGSIQPPPSGAAFEGKPGGEAAPKPAGEGVKPPETPPPTPIVEPLPGGPPGTHVNLNRIGASDAVKSVIAELNRAQGEKLAGHRAPKRHEQTVARSFEALPLEKALALDPDTTVLTAEQGLALRRWYNEAATHLEALQTRADAGDAAAVGQVYAATAVAGRLALLDEAIARNIARSLESRSIESQPRRGKYDPHELGLLAQALETASEVDGAVFLKRLAELKTKEQKRGFLGQIVQALRFGIHSIQTIWTHNLLTNPVTHGANIGGTTLTTLAEIPERFTAEIGHQVFSSNPKGVQRGETQAYIRGLADGIFTDGIRFMGMASRGEDPFMGKGSIERGPFISADKYGWDSNTVHGRFVDVTGAVLDNLPAFWALRVEDAFFKGLNYHAEIGALAVREARAEGLKGKALSARIADLEAHPTPAMMLAAQDAALLRTLNTELGPMGRAFATIINETPGGRVVVPFVRTPTNSVKWWGQRAPILNLLSVQNWQDIQAGGAAREKAIARQVLGSAVGAAVAWQVFQGNITGAGPTDRNLKRDQRELGLQPFSIKVGDSMYGYSRLDPVGGYLGLIATATELMSQVPSDEWPEHITDALIIAGAETMANKTSLMGLSNVMEAIKNPDRKGHFFMKGLARSVVPAGVRQFTRTAREEGVLLDTQTLLDEIRAGIPGWSDSVPAMLNIVTGEPIRIPPGWGPDMISPVLISKLGDDPVLAQIVEHHISIPPLPRAMAGAAPKKGPTIEEPRATIGVPLTALQRYRWAVLMSREYKDGEGRTLHQRLTDIVRSEEYARQSPGPDGRKADLIKDTVRIYRQQAAAMLLEEDPELAAKVGVVRRERIQRKLPLEHEEARPMPAVQTPAARQLLERIRGNQAPDLGR